MGITIYLFSFYLFIRKRASKQKKERERWRAGEPARAGGGAKGEGKADSPLSREPDHSGLDPGTPGSTPELKADTSTEPARCPLSNFILNVVLVY